MRVGAGRDGERERGHLGDGEHGVLRHDGDERLRAVLRGADRHGDGDRQDPAGGDGGARRGGEDAAGPEDRRVWRAAGEGDSVDLRGGVGDELPPVLGPRVRRLLQGLHLLSEGGRGAGRRRHSRRPPCRDHAVSVAGYACDGEAQLHRPQAAVGGDAGLHDSHLLRQDGNADDERDVRGGAGARWQRRSRRLSRGGGRLLQPRWRHQGIQGLRPA